MFVSAVVLQVGDILTQVESVDEQWIMGVVGEKRGIVPKNYISLLWGVGQQEVDSVNRSVNTCHTCQHVLQRFFQNFPGVCFNVHTAACSALIGCWTGGAWTLMESNWCHAGDFCRPVGFSFLPVSRLDWIWLFSFPSWSLSSGLVLTVRIDPDDGKCWTDVSHNCFIQRQLSVFDLGSLNSAGLERTTELKLTFVFNTSYREEHYSHPEPEEIRKPE